MLQEKRKRQDDRKKEAKALGDAAPPKLVPKTLDALREHDETTVLLNTTTKSSRIKMENGEKDEEDEQVDQEVQWDITNDEFKDYFNKTYEPKVIITSGDNPHSVNCQEEWKHF